MIETYWMHVLHVAYRYHACIHMCLVLNLLHTVVAMIHILQCILQLPLRRTKGAMCYLSESFWLQIECSVHKYDSLLHELPREHLHKACEL